MTPAYGLKIITILISDSDEEMVTAPVSAEELICKLYCLMSVHGEKQVVYQCKDAYASVRLHRDMFANVDSSDYICRRVDVYVRLSLEI